MKFEGGTISTLDVITASASLNNVFVSQIYINMQRNEKKNKEKNDTNPQLTLSITHLHSS